MKRSCLPALLSAILFLFLMTGCAEPASVAIPPGLVKVVSVVAAHPGPQTNPSMAQSMKAINPERAKELQSWAAEPLQGAGCVLGEDGYIITSAFLARGEVARNYEVILSDNHRLSAKLIGKDSLSDVAVLKVNAQHLPAPIFADIPLKVGEEIKAAGFPDGKPALTAGKIVKLDQRYFFPYMERFAGVSVPYQTGYSGGMVLNHRQQVVAWIISFDQAPPVPRGAQRRLIQKQPQQKRAMMALPAARMKTIAQEIIATGKIARGFLGLRVSNRPPGEAGVEVLRVFPGSAADRAWIAGGDILLELNNKPIKNADLMQQEISHAKPGEKVKLSLLRNGKRLSLTATLEALWRENELQSK